MPAPWFRGIAESLFATVFPSECRLCDAFLTNISRLPVCEDCVSAIHPMEGIFCSVCGERLAHRHVIPLPDVEAPENVCEICLKESPPYTAASAYGSYEAGLREMVHLLKYEKVRPAAAVLGAMLAVAIEKMQPQMTEQMLFAEPMLVIPVPLHRSKMRERGFNQAELIAAAAVKRKPQFKLTTNLLKRRRVTESQIGLTKHQRKENLRGAFKVTKPEIVKDREVLLVDDVLTTGTTAAECALVLLRAGATKVWVATVARTLKRSGQAAEGLKAPAGLAG